MLDIGLPGLNGFIGEFLVLIGAYTRYWLAAAFGVTALVLSSIYILWLYQRVMTGPVTDGNERIRDLVPREIRDQAKAFQYNLLAPLFALLRTSQPYSVVVVTVVTTLFLITV